MKTGKRRLAPKLKRGQVWTADLHPSVGWELGKERPVLIISDDNVNENSAVIVVIPFSSILPPSIGFERLLFKGGEAGLKKDSVLLVSHVRAIDKSRLRKYVSHIANERLAEVEDGLKLVLGFEPVV